MLTRSNDVTRITLRFLTPTMLKADGVQARRPVFGVIAKRLRDRINALSYFYCGKGLDIDFKDFGEQAEKIKTVADSTRWVESSRYSRRREVTHDLSGFVGEVTFEGELECFCRISNSASTCTSARTRCSATAGTRSYARDNDSPRRSRRARREEDIEVSPAETQRPQSSEIELEHILERLGTFERWNVR